MRLLLSTAASAIGGGAASGGTTTTTTNTIATISSSRHGEFVRLCAQGLAQLPRPPPSRTHHASTTKWSIASSTSRIAATDTYATAGPTSRRPFASIASQRAVPPPGAPALSSPYALPPFAPPLPQLAGVATASASAHQPPPPWPSSSRGVHTGAARAAQPPTSSAGGGGGGGVAATAGASAGAGGGGAARRAPTREVVLYCGPASVRPWLHWIGGLFFFLSGVSVASVVEDNLSWPIISRDPKNPPRLLTEWKRKVAAGVLVFMGAGFAWLFWIIPSRTITRLALLPSERKLVIRTANPGLTSLFPRSLLLGPFLRVVRDGGYHLRARRDERVVPLDSVYRIYGSAVGKEAAAARGASAANAKPGNKNKRGRRGGAASEDRKVQIVVGRDRLFYTLEAEGGKTPDELPEPPNNAYARMFRWMQYGMRGYTEGIPDEAGGKAATTTTSTTVVGAAGREGSAGGGGGGQAGATTAKARRSKKPWFRERRNFDELLPRTQGR